MPHKFRELLIWQRAMTLTTHIYALSRVWPKDELFGLTSQIRRASVSIAINIAEGSGNDSNAEFVRFLTYALRSSYEVMTALELAQRLGYSQSTDITPLLSEADTIAAMTTTFMQKLKHSNSNRAKEDSVLYAIDEHTNDEDNQDL